MIAKADFNSSPHVGIYCVANDDYAIVPRTCSADFESLVREKLGVDIVKTSISNTSLVGIFCTANNKLLLVPSIIEREELKILKDSFPEVLVIDDKYTALGNLVAMNDHGIAVSIWAAGVRKVLKDAVECHIAGSDLVGSATVACNKAFITHRDASPAELASFEKIFKVKGVASTINFGDPFVHSGFVANSRGVLVGSMTGGHEMSRIDELFMQD